MLGYVGGYIRSALFGGGGAVASAANLASLVLGITAIAAIALLAKLEVASVAVSFLAFLVLLVVTHYGSYGAYAEERRKREGHERKIRVKAQIGGYGINYPDPGPDKSSLHLHIFWEVWVDKDVSTDAVALNLIHLYDRHWWQFWKRVYFPQTGIRRKGEDTTQYRKRIYVSENQPFRDDAVFEYVEERDLPGDPHWLAELVLKFGMPDCEYRVPISFADHEDEIRSRGTSPPL